MTPDAVDDLVCDLIDLALDGDGPLFVTEHKCPELRQEQRALIAALRAARLAFGLFKTADGTVALMLWPAMTPRHTPPKSCGRMGAASRS